MRRARPRASLQSFAAASATLLGMGMDAGPTALQIAAALAVARSRLRSCRCRAPPTPLLVTYSVASSATGAAAIHYAVIADHLEEWWAFGVFFAAIGVAQLLWAALVVASPHRS